jgi:hypothetical protein
MVWMMARSRIEFGEVWNFYAHGQIGMKFIRNILKFLKVGG